MEINEKTIAFFFSRLIKLEEDTCWGWSGDKASNGYSRMRDAIGKRIGAHRVSYFIFKGEVQEGLEIDHLCRNRACLNPKHLEAVTPRINVLRGIGPAATNHKKLFCIRGHSLSGENLILKNGSRNCLTCRREWDKQYQKARRSKVKQEFLPS